MASQNLALVEPEVNPPSFTDDQLVADAVLAREEAETAEEKASPSRWREADDYAELSMRGWSTRKIAEACGTNRNTVSLFVRCSECHPRVTERPSFWQAYQEIRSDKKVRGTQGTGENEWYTPSKYIEAARSVLGEIDLDPASNDTAQEIVRASTYLTKEENGLVQPWEGRVWLNPPYAQPMISEFVSKMVEEYKSRRVTAAIMLTHNYTDTEWFHEAASVASAICFTRRRIKFISPDGEEASPTQGQAFFFFGGWARTGLFYEVFSEFGRVMLLDSPCPGGFYHIFDTVDADGYESGSQP